jgi:hypothetical protein
MQTLKECRTSGTLTKGKEQLPKCRPGVTGLKLSKSKGPSQDPGKHQITSGGTPECKQVKRTRQNGQLSYAGTAPEGLQMVIICDSYPETQVSKKKFVSFQHAIGGLVEKLLEEGSPPGSSVLIGLKELPLWYAMIRG